MGIFGDFGWVLGESNAWVTYRPEAGDTTTPGWERAGGGPDMGTDDDRGAAPRRWTAQVFLPSQQFVSGALCLAEPSHACGWCPLPGRTLPCLWVVPYTRQNPPMLVGGALCQAEPSHACGWCPMPRRTLPCLWVVPYAWQNPPMLVGGALCQEEPSHAFGWCPRPSITLPCLWVVPFAWQNPPMLVGGALCRVEPSYACGWCRQFGTR